LRRRSVPASLNNQRICHLVGLATLTAIKRRRLHSVKTSRRQGLNQSDQFTFREKVAVNLHGVKD